MRLLRLYIGDYRVLSQLNLRFDPNEPIEEKNQLYHLDFLVGVNGTGKSTVLRLLGKIFKGIQNSFDELQSLPFILEYWLESQNKRILISNIHPNERNPLDHYFVTTAPGLNEPYDISEPNNDSLVDNVPAALLPNRIISYTTGSEEEWLNQLYDDNFTNSSLESIQQLPAHERILKEMPGWAIADLSDEIEQQKKEGRFRFIQQKQLVLVALCGLLQHCAENEQESALQGVLKDIGFEKLVGFSLHFKLPYATDVDRKNIWSQIGQYATQTLRNGSEYRLIFDLSDPNLAKTLLENNGGVLSFFEVLSDWYSDENQILVKVSLLIQRAPIKPQNGGEAQIPPLHTWNWLSDGERSFLGRMCLFSLFGETESLILLDEPEVHFNDFWKRHIVSTMHQVFERKNSNTVSHVLVATHSSISLSDVRPEDILILERKDLLTNTTKMPGIQTFGADPSEIMVHVFGTPYAEGAYSVSEIENWLSDISQKSEQEQRDYLKTIAPGYWAYRIRREMSGVTLK